MIKIGDSASLTKTFTDQDVRSFAVISGDNNPVHLDEEYAKTTQFGERIAHGMFSALLVTAAVATKLPGPVVRLRLCSVIYRWDGGTTTSTRYLIRTSSPM